MAFTRVGEVGARWLLACEDVSPEAEKHPMLEDITTSAAKTITENISMLQCPMNMITPSTVTPITRY
jgi:hypothetical protein